MKRAILFYNGDLSKIKAAKSYLQPDDYIICADGGTKHALKLGIIPHVIIGDLDSLSKTLQKKLAKHQIEWVTYHKEKDETDSELALQYALKKGYKTVLVFGFFGSRLDHMLTNIFAVDYLCKQNIDVMFIEDNQEIRVTNDKLQLHGKQGDLVSLVPLKSDARKVTTKNLQYPLLGEDLYFGYSRGISNVMTTSTAEVSVKEGALLVIHTKY